VLRRLAIAGPEAAIDAGDSVLDVGCGRGATTLAVARRPTVGEALGIDLSVPMLNQAQSDARAAGIANASFFEGDAQVYPFEPDRFDAVISRLGLMFFADPLAAFANLRHATMPGGRIVFVCWQPLAANQWLLVPGAALAEHVPVPDLGSPDAPGMFALSDPDRVQRHPHRFGWHEVDVTATHTSMVVGGSGTLDEAVELLRTGSMGRALLAGTDLAAEARAVASVRAALAPHAEAGGVRLDAAAWLVRAIA
jgi:SAM-dependent methyltransferase